MDEKTTRCGRCGYYPALAKYHGYCSWDCLENGEDDDEDGEAA
jgi:hypothetical protein